MHTRHKINKRNIYPGAFINMSTQKTCVEKQTTKKQSSPRNNKILQHSGKTETEFLAETDLQL